MAATHTFIPVTNGPTKFKSSLFNNGFRNATHTPAITELYGGNKVRFETDDFEIEMDVTVDTVIIGTTTYQPGTNPITTTALHEILIGLFISAGQTALPIARKARIVLDPVSTYSTALTFAQGSQKFSITVTADGANNGVWDYNGTPGVLTKSVGQQALDNTSSNTTAIALKGGFEVSPNYAAISTTRTDIREVYVQADELNNTNTGTGTITTTTSSPNVVGVGTTALADIKKGNRIFQGSTLIGTVLSVTDNFNFTLTSNAAVAVSGSAYIINGASLYLFDGVTQIGQKIIY